MRLMTEKCRRKLENGLSMIEVLVSMTIVAFAVLGLLGLQARALSYQKDSTDRRAAAEMVAQLSERIRANARGLSDGAYAGQSINFNDPDPAAPATCAVPTACTLLELANRDFGQWSGELRRRLPGSAAYIQWTAADPSRLVVSIGWVEPNAGADLTSLCNDINLRLTVAMPANYRCYEIGVRP